MKVLLIGEASGVHRNLKKGLAAHGVNAELAMLTAWPQYPYHDRLFSPDLPGLAGGIARNVAPFATIFSLNTYDVINFTNTITTVVGQHLKYFDLPFIRRKAKILSYFAVGCDEIGLIRHNQALPYKPCESCMASGEQLGRDCANVFNPIYDQSRALVRKHFDFGASSMVEYDRCSDLFSHFAHIRLPIDVDPIRFRPAGENAVSKLIHTPSRRGFKGTDRVLAAIDMLQNERSDFEFRIVEGLAYHDYLTAIDDADIVIDQVHSQSSGMNGYELLAAGKIVLTGATELGIRYHSDEAVSPAIDASPDPAQLAKSLSSLLDRKSEFGEIAARGRHYVERWHDPALIAGNFIAGWSNTNTPTTEFQSSPIVPR